VSYIRAVDAADSPSGAPRGVERRDALRIDILGTLRADVLIPQRIEITNISAAGLQAVSSFPFQLDAVHDFRLTLDDRIVVVKGRVVHSAVRDIDPEGVEYRTGIDFVDLAEDIRREIDSFAARLADRRREGRL
jgi:hypothetical protein